MNKPDFNIVTDCGSKKRTIYRYNTTCYIGCFEGTYDEAISAISKKYEYYSRDSYIKKIDMLYGNTATIDMVKKYNNFILDIVSTYGHIELLKWLTYQGIDLTYNDNETIKTASRCGHLEIMKWISQQGVDVVNVNYLMLYATEYGHLDIVKWLVSKGVKITYTLLIYAVDYDHLHIVKYFVSNNEYTSNEKYRAFLLATENKYYDIIKYLIHADDSIAIENKAIELARI